MMARPLRILVVDDDVDNAQSLGELFEMDGVIASCRQQDSVADMPHKGHELKIARYPVERPIEIGIEDRFPIRAKSDREQRKSVPFPAIQRQSL